MGNGRKIMFLNYGSLWKIGILKALLALHLDYYWTAIGFKSECGILPDLGFVFGLLQY